jgi:cation-transporting ATPase F
MAEARTVAMNVFVAIEIVYLFSCRSLHLAVTSVPLFSNLWVWAGAGLQIAMQLAITYWPPMNTAFSTAPISARAWVEIIAIALVAMLVIEVEKRLRR